MGFPDEDAIIINPTTSKSPDKISKTEQLGTKGKIKWYISGLNSEIFDKNKIVKFDFLPEGTKYKLTLISDGKHDKELVTDYIAVDKSSSVSVKLLRRGGFAAKLKRIQ